MKFLRKYPKEITKKNSNKYNKKTLKKSSLTKNEVASSLQYGTMGVKLLENCKLEHYQLESFRRLFLPYTKTFSKVWYKGNFSIPLTKKSIGTRMGKGKGKLDHWVSLYKKGEVIIEFEFFFNRIKLKSLFRIFKHKFPFKFVLIIKSNVKKYIR